jgi:hypothetical protein
LITAHASNAVRRELARLLIWIGDPVRHTRIRDSVVIDAQVNERLTLSSHVRALEEEELQILLRWR